MIVFVLSGDLDYDGNTLIGIYATSASAMAASPGNWSGNDVSGYTRIANKRESFDTASIVPFRVQS